MKTLLYSSEKNMDMKAGAEFITRLLNGVTMVHMHHLMTDSYSAHMALGELYDGLQDLSDGLAESCMGCCGQKYNFEGGTVSIGADAISDVKALYSYVDSNRQVMGSDTHIQNDIDGICTLLCSILYKLTQLK